MNLEFQTVRTITQDGISYYQQRAVIEKDNRQFWYSWKTCKESLRKHLQLRRDLIDGSPVWTVWRLLPVNAPGVYGEFKSSYIVGNTTKLYPYQPKAVSRLVYSLQVHGCGIDGSDTGIGKTFHSLAVCRELHVSPAIVCRKSGIAGWKKACIYMDIKPVFIVNWELAKSSHFEFTRRAQNPFSGVYEYTWRLPADTLLIFDEQHMANHDGSQNFQLYIAAKGIPSVSLSATFADKPSRLKALMYLLDISSMEKFDEFLLSRGHFYNTHGSLESLSERQDMLELNRMLYPKYGCRISYNDPDVKRFFPDVNIQTHLIELSVSETKRQNDLYREMLSKVIQYRDAGKKHSADQLVAELKYRQAAELFKAETLAELAMEYIYEGKSVLVFVNFIETLKYLAQRLKTKSVIFGSDEAAGLNRAETIERFQANINKVIICMIEAGGQSINLHDIHGGHQRISLICPTYTSISLRQVFGRTRRAGAKTLPIIKLVYAANTVEEKVAERVQQKLKNIDALMDGDIRDELAQRVHETGGAE